MNDYIKEELNTLREYLRFSLLVLLALTTAVVTNVYQVITHSKPLYSIVFSFIGFPLFILLFFIIRYLVLSIIEKTNKLKEYK